MTKKRIIMLIIILILLVSTISATRPSRVVKMKEGEVVVLTCPASTIVPTGESYYTYKNGEFTLVQPFSCEYGLD